MRGQVLCQPGGNGHHTSYSRLITLEVALVVVGKEVIEAPTRLLIGLTFLPCRHTPLTQHSKPRLLFRSTKVGERVAGR